MPRRTRTPSATYPIHLHPTTHTYLPCQRFPPAPSGHGASHDASAAPEVARTRTLLPAALAQRHRRAPSTSTLLATHPHTPIFNTSASHLRLAVAVRLMMPAQYDRWRARACHAPPHSQSGVSSPWSQQQNANGRPITTTTRTAHDYMTGRRGRGQRRRGRRRREVATSTPAAASAPTAATARPNRIHQVPRVQRKGGDEERRSGNPYAPSMLRSTSPPSPQRRRPHRHSPLPSTMAADQLPSCAPRIPHPTLLRALPHCTSISFYVLFFVSCFF